MTFALNQYTITPSAGPNGTISPSVPTNVSYGGSQLFTFSPSTGYHVDSLYLDGVYSGNPTSYTFTNDTANHTIRVTFAINKYTITPTAGPNGSISPSVPTSVNYDGSQLFTFTPSTGYHVDSLYLDGVYSGNPASYTFTNDTANHTIRVTFAINQFTITPSSGPNGSISPSVPTNVNYGGSQLFTFTPSTGYHVDSLYLDGVYFGNPASYTFTNDTANHTIRVTFAINKYTITPTAGPNGSISPSVPTSVNYGGSQLFTFTPSTGYHVDSLYLDGVYSGNPASYTFTNDTANHSIRVTFAINQFTLTPSSGPNGSISPSVPTIVNYGGSQLFTFTPSTGYHVDSIYVDGSYAGKTTTYNFTTVTANHTIQVTFAINQYTITPSAGPNGSISPSVPTSVNYGGSQTFSIHGNTGYYVDSILVDNISKPPDTTYTFTNDTANHTIRVVFAPNTLSITVGANLAGLTVKVNGTAHAAPYTFSSTAGVPITIAVDSIQGDTAVRALYRSWNDLGAISHIITPLINTNDTANFQQQYYLKMAAKQA